MLQYGDERLADGKVNVTSDKHDILYSRARCVLNQRHIKRPWFNLNPFLERMDETTDLDSYLPEESKYIQRLESLVLCENYHTDYPTDTREVEIGGFFDYLYSESWRHGRSVRILEGQLLDQLLHTLHNLHTRGDVICHTTYAFAHNKRPRTGCYKLADKETFGYFDETLLLEFTYFGRLSKEEPNTVTSHPLAYLRAHDNERRIIADSPPQPMPPLTSQSQQLDCLPELAQARCHTRAASINVEPSQFQRGKRSLKLQADTNLDSIPATSAAPAKRTCSMIRAAQCMQRGRRSSLPPPTQPLPMLKTVPDKRMHSLLESRKGERRRSARCWESPIPFGGNLRSNTFRTLSGVDTDSFTEEDDNECSKDDTTYADDVQYLGEELYLGDDRKDETRDMETTVRKLQRLHSELHLRREQVKRNKQDKAARSKTRTGIPPLPPLNMEMTLDKPALHYKLGMPDEMPTFEKFVKLLYQEEQTDLRYNKTKKKSKTIAERYNQEHSDSRYNMSCVSKYDADSSYLRMHATGRKASTSSRKGSFLDVGHDRCRLPVLHEKSKLDNQSAACLWRDRWQYADDVLGVTDSEPCKDHWLKQTGALNGDTPCKDHWLKQTGAPNGDTHRHDRHHTPSSGMQFHHQFKQRAAASVTPISTPDILVVSPSGNSECLHRGSRSTIGLDDTSSFDSTKLNQMYSVERLRKKQRLEKKNKKPIFYDVLKKYYRMQALRKGSAGMEERAARGRSSRRVFANFLKGDQDLESETTIGSLKKFKFQDTKKTKKMNRNNLPTGNFSSPDIERFESQLEAALGHFVIRREVVVSGINSRCAMSITFNRKSAFRFKQK